jgi:Pseudomonas avirulence D protein (AvrD)
VPGPGKGRRRLPRDWSAKTGHAELRPHLSSIDAVALAAQITERGLAQGLSLDSEQRRRMWIRSITFRGGTSPLLDLCDFDVSAAVTRSAPDPFSLCGHASTVECRIGPVKVILEVEHEPGRPVTPHAERPADSSAGETAGGYYGDEYKKTIREIRGITADPEAGGVEALVTMRNLGSDGTARPLTGIGGAYHPCLTPIWCRRVRPMSARPAAPAIAPAPSPFRRDQGQIPACGAVLAAGCAAGAPGPAVFPAGRAAR